MKYETNLFRLLSLAAILFCFASGCEQRAKGPKGPPSSATIVTMEPAAGPSAVTMLGNPADLKKLAAFFPSHATAPKSHVAGSWIPTHTVYLDYPRGISIRISLAADVDGGLWSWGIGNGDFPIQGDFSEFIAAIQQN